MNGEGEQRLGKVSQLENEKASLNSQRASAEHEKNTVNDHVLKIECEKTDLEWEKGLANTLNLSEQTRLEDDVQQLDRIRAEHSEQLDSLTGQKNLLSEQLIAARKELERQADTILHLEKENEEIYKEHGEMCAHVITCERENRHQREEIAALKKDKDELESRLCDIQQVQSQLETKKEHLSGEVERLRSELESLMDKSDQQRRAKADQDHQKALSNEKQQSHDEDQRRLTQNLKQIRAQVESEQNRMHEPFAHECDPLLLHEIARMQQDREEQKEMLSRSERERSLLQEKLTSLQRNLATALFDHARQRHAIETLQGELRTARSNLEQSSKTHERVTKNLRIEIVGLHQRRDAARADLSDLRTKLKLCDEARAQLKRDLAEVNRNLQLEGSHKEMEAMSALKQILEEVLSVSIKDLPALISERSPDVRDVFIDEQKTLTFLKRHPSVFYVGDAGSRVQLLSETTHEAINCISNKLAECGRLDLVSLCSFISKCPNKEIAMYGCRTSRLKSLLRKYSDVFTVTSEAGQCVVALKAK